LEFWPHLFSLAKAGTDGNQAVTVDQKDDDASGPHDLQDIGLVFLLDRGVGCVCPG
jgi:hypothetical protein